MTVAVAATRFPDTARPDPRDEVDYIFNFGGILETGEEIASYAMVLPAESVALGLEIMEGGGRDHALLTADDITDGDLRDGDGVLLLENCAIKAWLTIDAAYRDNAAFNVSGGSSLPVEVTATTNSVPARTRQRTALIKVVQQ